MPEARSYTTIAVETLGDWTRASASRTLVDSAPAGTHCDVSFFSAPLSFFDSGKASTSTTTQKPTTTHLVQLPAGISAIFRSLLIDPPPVLTTGRTRFRPDLLSTMTARVRRGIRGIPDEDTDIARGGWPLLSVAPAPPTTRRSAPGCRSRACP